jgi:hypothetical protein
VKPEIIYPYTRNNPDLTGYAVVAAGTVAGFFAVVLAFRAFDQIASQVVQAPMGVSPTAGTP